MPDSQLPRDFELERLLRESASGRKMADNDIHLSIYGFPLREHVFVSETERQTYEIEMDSWRRRHPF